MGARVRCVDGDIGLEAVRRKAAFDADGVRGAGREGDHERVHHERARALDATSIRLTSVAQPQIRRSRRVRDLRGTATARQHRLWSYLLTHGRADTPAERLDQDNHMLADMGPAPSPGTIEHYLEGWEGRAARRNAANLREQYARLQEDGTAGLTAEQASTLLRQQRDAGRITPEEYNARVARLASFGQTAERCLATFKTMRG